MSQAQVTENIQTVNVYENVKSGLNGAKGSVKSTSAHVKNHLFNPGSGCGTLTRKDGTSSDIEPTGICYMFTGILVITVACTFLKDLTDIIKQKHHQYHEMFIRLIVGGLSIVTMLVHCNRCTGLRGVAMVFIIYFIGWMITILMCGSNKSCIHRNIKK
jgi:hypothetical protein